MCHGGGESHHRHREKEHWTVQVNHEPEEATQSRSECRLQEEATEWHPAQKPEGRGRADEEAAESADECGEPKDVQPKAGQYVDLEPKADESLASLEPKAQ